MVKRNVAGFTKLHGLPKKKNRRLRQRVLLLRTLSCSVVGLMGALLYLPVAQADTVPYLLQQIEQAKPDAEAIAKAKKQVVEHKDTKLQKISLVPFHLRKKQPINPSQVYCTECHLPLPHLKTLRSRAFLNMHTDYVACETCHFRPENVSLTYGWYDYKQEKSVDGSPALFHSGRKKDDKSPLVPRNGQLKIVPLLNGEAVIASRKHPAAKAIYQQWKDTSLPDKGALKAQLHTPLKTKGPECRACHTGRINQANSIDELAPAKAKKAPLLDFSRLGANNAQQTAILQNTIADFFAHYQPDREAALDGKQTTEAADSLKPPKEQRIRITNFLK